MSADRFWSWVDQTATCWEWTGDLVQAGYGRIWWEGKTRRAHRVSWVLSYGPIPEGLWVLHRCDNPSCVRPDHLFLGTALDNALDRERKGRGFEAQQTVCQRGHELDGANVYRHPTSGVRNCRTCRNEASSRSNRRRAEQRVCV